MIIQQALLGQTAERREDRWIFTVHGPKDGYAPAAFTPVDCVNKTAAAAAASATMSLS